jgi:hypothetical protein
LQNGNIGYKNKELTSSVQKSRELLKENFPTSTSLLEEEQRKELMLMLYLISRKKHLKKTGMAL